MIDNNKKIEKLNQLLTFAIENISPIDLLCDDDKIWNLIDKIIKINDYIDKLKTEISNKE